jgi:putative oxidoreductase
LYELYWSIDMSSFGSESHKNGVILAARILLAILFLIFGWNKLTDYSGTMAYMQMTGDPVPPLSAVVAIIVELFGGLAILLGILTRPLAVLMAVYAIVTALIGHHYWTMTGMARFEAEINFFKNVSIAGGFLLLYVTGAGGYAVDAKMKRA